MAAGSLFALFGVGLALLMAAGELLSPVRDARKRLAAVIFACLGFTLLHGELLMSGRMLSVPHFYMLSIPANYFLGPLLYDYSRRSLGEEGRGRWALYSGVPLAALAAMLPVWAQFAPEKTRRIQAVLNGEWPGYEVLVFMGGLLYFTFFLLLTLRMLRPLLAPGVLRVDPAVRVVALFCGAGLVLNLGALIAVPLGWNCLSRALILSTAGVIIAVYFLGRMYPKFFHDLITAANEEKYKHSQIKGLNLEHVSRRLEKIMRAEKAYRDEDLSLAGLAERVELNSHQLSEYFNNHLKLNFAGYVNGFRVEEAAELLLREPDRTVLSIAFETGFNSKSNFNTAFARHMGLSPTRWRKKHAAAK